MTERGKLWFTVHAARLEPKVSRDLWEAAKQGGSPLRTLRERERRICPPTQKPPQDAA